MFDSITYMDSYLGKSHAHLLTKKNKLEMEISNILTIQPVCKVYVSEFPPANMPSKDTATVGRNNLSYFSPPYNWWCGPTLYHQHFWDANELGVFLRQISSSRWCIALFHE